MQAFNIPFFGDDEAKHADPDEAKHETPTVVANMYDLGFGESFVRLENMNDWLAREARQRPHIVVVLDISGSMGNYAPKIINTSVPNALEAAGVLPDEAVTVIVFNTYVRNIGRCTIGGLRNSHFAAGGMTYMSGVFAEHLQPVYAST